MSRNINHVAHTVNFHKEAGLVWVNFSIGIIIVSFISLLMFQSKVVFIPLFFLGLILALLSYNQSRSIIITLGKEYLTLYSGFPGFRKQIRIEWYNIDRVFWLKRDRKANVGGGLYFNAIGEVTEEFIVIELKMPPLPADLSILRDMRDTYPGPAFSLGDNEKQIFIRQAPKEGFKNLLKSFSQFVEVENRMK